MPSPPAAGPSRTRKWSESTCAEESEDEDSFDEEEAQLFIENLGLDLFGKEAMTLLRTSAELVADSKAWEASAHRRFKDAVNKLYGRVDKKIIQRASKIWGWMIDSLCIETRWTNGLGASRRAAKGRLFQLVESPNGPMLEKTTDWKAVSVPDWALEETGETLTFIIDDSPTSAPVQYFFQVFAILFTQGNGEKVLREYERAAAEKRPARMANMLSGHKSAQRSVPAIYGQLTPSKKIYTGLARNAKLRDGVHKSRKGNRHRQKEEKTHPFSQWRRETIFELDQKLFAEPEEFLDRFLFISEHLTIAATNSNNPDTGINHNRIDQFVFNKGIPLEIVRCLWDGVILWVDQRVSEGLSAVLPRERDTHLWQKFSPFVADTLSPVTMAAIALGRLHRADTEKFPRQMPLAATANILTTPMMTAEEREKEKLYADGPTSFQATARVRKPRDPEQGQFAVTEKMMAVKEPKDRFSGRKLKK